MTFAAREHRFVRTDRALDWLRLGWMPLPSLAGTHHGAWSVHCVWICGCAPRAVRGGHE